MGRRRVVLRAIPRSPTAPLRFLAANRLRRSRPVAGGAPPFLLDALAVAGATATSSPSSRRTSGPSAPSSSERGRDGGARAARRRRGRGDPQRHRLERLNTPAAASGGRQTRQRAVRGVAEAATPVLTLACVAPRPWLPAGDQGWRAQGRREGSRARREQRRDRAQRKDRRSRRSRAASGDADASRVVHEARRGTVYTRRPPLTIPVYITQLCASVFPSVERLSGADASLTTPEALASFANVRPAPHARGAGDRGDVPRRRGVSRPPRAPCSGARRSTGVRVRRV